MSLKRISIIEGDGIGPDIMKSTLSILNAAGCAFAFDYVEAGKIALEQTGNSLPTRTLNSIDENRVALIGPLFSPTDSSLSSVHTLLREHYNLFANVRPVRSFKTNSARYDNLDIITIRENTQGMYSQHGQSVSEDGNEAESLSKITRESAERILTFAYELARREGRNRVTAVHKADILKSTSGLFLKVAKEIGEKYPDIESKEMQVDTCSMQLVMNPHQFDVIVTTNLFGDIVSDLCAGLVGGLGMAPSANIGKGFAIFETVHGAAPELVGKDLANPTSLILCAIQMLKYLGMGDKSDKIMHALTVTVESGEFTTRDLGGSCGTQAFTDAVIACL